MFTYIYLMVGTQVYSTGNNYYYYTCYPLILVCLPLIVYM